MSSIDQIFISKKPIIGMVHIGNLLGQDGFEGLPTLIQKAITDINALQNGGVDGLLIENWKEDSASEFVSVESCTSFSMVVYEISKYIKVPFGINVLNNDYKTMFSVAKLVNANFVQLDVFVDHVKSDFSYSSVGKNQPFEIDPRPQEVWDYAKSVGAENLPLFCFVQPKHYKLIDPDKKIEESIVQARESGASAILITKATGVAPTIDLVKRAKLVAKIPVGIGSGFNLDNAEQFLQIVDFAVVGTAMKKNEVTDNEVDLKKVQELMSVVKRVREKSLT